MAIRKTTVVVALTAVVIGVALGLNETRKPGYVVAYSIIAVLLLSAAIAAVSVILLLPRRSRSIGRQGVVAAVMLFVSFYGTVAGANAMGAWDDEMVAVGSEVQASVVVLFKAETSDEAIYYFVTNVIATPHPGGGSQNLPGMRSMLKVRIGEHDGYAIQIDREATDAQRRQIRKRIAESQIVWRVFENVAPDKIVLPKAGSALEPTSAHCLIGLLSRSSRGPKRLSWGRYAAGESTKENR